MYINLSQLADYLRLTLAFNNLIIFIWSTVWFVTFMISHLRRRRNGPTVALIIKLGATSLFHLYLLAGFAYLVSPHVTPARTVIFLLWGCLSSAGIIVSYVVLQFQFGSENER